MIGNGVRLDFIGGDKLPEKIESDPIHMRNMAFERDAPKAARPSTLRYEPLERESSGTF